MRAPWLRKVSGEARQSCKQSAKPEIIYTETLQLKKKKKKDICYGYIPPSEEHQISNLIRQAGFTGGVVLSRLMAAVDGTSVISTQMKT